MTSRIAVVLVVALSLTAVAQDHAAHQAQAKPVTLVTGLGNLHHPVSTKNPEAQKFFDQGLRYIYAGNLPGKVGRWENTYCPNCDELLVERYGYLIRQMRVTPQGQCPACAESIPGIWSS